MSKLKTLVAEIHRRSLWQVLLIYIGAAWACFELIATVADTMGLPTWLPGLAIVLFLLGLPFVVATALVREEPAPSVVSPGATEAEAQRAEVAAATARREATRRSRFLTWRNAGLSFLVALALWGVVATGWMLFGDSQAETRAIVDVRPSIAVLPFVNRSTLEEDEYFSDGVHDEILTQLSKIGGLSVRGRTSVMQYRDSPKNLRQIGEELKAQYLLEGGVQRVEDTVRINVQLIDAHADEHVWTGTYDRELSIENLLSVQSEIAQRVAASLNATVTLEEQRRIEAAPTGNIEAYEHYLRGMVNWPWGNWDARVELFDRAVTLDPSFLLPYARLELIHCHRYWVGIDHSEQGLALCENAVNRALSIDPDHPESRAARGHYLMYIHSDSERALRDFEVAQLGGVDTRHLTALAEWSLGNVERAATILTELCDIYDPRNGNVCETACDVYLQLRDYSEAERYCDRAIALVPTNIDPAVLKAQVVIRRDGDIDRARQLLHAIPGVVGDTSAYPASYYMTEWILLELLARKYEQALEMLASSPPMLYQSQYRYVPKSLLYAKVYALMDSMHVARVFYDSARAFLEVELATQPDDARVRSALGIAYAGVGRRDSAVSHGTRAVELSMSTRGMKSRAVAALAEIYAIVNEHGAAIDQLEYLMSVPGETSVSVLRLDPIWDPLRDHPRFQALLDKYE